MQRQRSASGQWSRSTASFLLSAWILHALAGDSSAGVILVNPGERIQAAIDAATTGDVIVVAQGTYREAIEFKGKDITVRSSDPRKPSVVAATIIDGTPPGQTCWSAVSFDGTETSACVLSGFTITGGNGTILSATGVAGGGICGLGTRATVQYNVITGNYVSRFVGASGSYDTRGGGIDDCDGIIQSNTISGNGCAGRWAAAGGGLYGCDGLIQNNLISENYTYAYSGPDYGGGFAFCNATIQNNIVYKNAASYGGGLASCGGVIRHNTIFGNTAYQGGGLHFTTGVIRNCIVWANTADIGPQLDQCSTPSYCCIQNWPGGGVKNLITSSPRLKNPATGDFHLLANSPCIDAGCGQFSVTRDFEGNPRPIDGTTLPRGDGSDYDIGAYEFVPPPASAGRWRLYDQHLREE